MRRQTGWKPPRRRWPEKDRDRARGLRADCQSFSAFAEAAGDINGGETGDCGTEPSSSSVTYVEEASLEARDDSGGGTALRGTPSADVASSFITTPSLSAYDGCRRSSVRSVSISSAVSDRRRPDDDDDDERRCSSSAEVVPVPVGSDDDEPTETPTEAPAINSAGGGGGCPAWFSSEPHETDFFRGVAFELSFSSSTLCSFGGMEKECRRASGPSGVEARRLDSVAAR